MNKFNCPKCGEVNEGINTTCVSCGADLLNLGREYYGDPLSFLRKGGRLNDKGKSWLVFRIFSVVMLAIVILIILFQILSYTGIIRL